jgi:hypothetical protein
VREEPTVCQAERPDYIGNMVTDRLLIAVSPFLLEELDCPSISISSYIHIYV